MKRLFVIAGVLVLAAGVVFTRFRLEAQDIANRLRTKASKAQAGVLTWSEQGRDPSAVLAVIRQVKPALDAGDPRQAEALLDRALQILSAGGAASEPGSDLYARPQLVSIEGYAGSAMEPFLSPDGRYLFFNNENDPNVNTNIHFAERTGKLAFRYLGELPGVNSPVLDAVPSVDQAGHFYFTTVRDYGRTLNSLFTGIFDGKAVTNVHPAPGDISPKSPGTINMDAGISPDGQTLYISRAVIVAGAPAPAKAELIIARLHHGVFHIDPESASILRNINTGGLQYAPCISPDGRELYFTRALPGALPRILAATRASEAEPFGEPRVLTALTGFVEAPTISLDLQEMFFHKKVGDRFAIVRAERN